MDQATVLAATIKLLREHGASGVTVRSVAAAVGVSRQVVYTQFGSLGGLIDALYREGFNQLLSAATGIPDTGVAGVIAHGLAYRRFALSNPELYQVMFERPFRGHTPSPESRAAALAAFEPLVDAVGSTGRDPEQARSLALTLWAAGHGLVHLELQGYFSSEPTTEARYVTIVNGVLGDAR